MFALLLYKSVKIEQVTDYVPLINSSQRLSSHCGTFWSEKECSHTNTFWSKVVVRNVVADVSRLGWRHSAHGKGAMEYGGIGFLRARVGGSYDEIEVVVHFVYAERLLETFVEVGHDAELNSGVLQRRQSLVRVRNHLPVRPVLESLPENVGDVAKQRDVSFVTGVHKDAADEVLPPFLGRHSVVLSVIRMLLLFLMPSVAVVTKRIGLKFQLRAGIFLGL